MVSFGGEFFRLIIIILNLPLIIIKILRTHEILIFWVRFLKLFFAKSCIKLLIEFIIFLLKVIYCWLNLNSILITWRLVIKISLIALEIKRGLYIHTWSDLVKKVGKLGCINSLIMSSVLIISVISLD